MPEEIADVGVVAEEVTPEEELKEDSVNCFDCGSPQLNMNCCDLKLPNWEPDCTCETTCQVPIKQCCTQKTFVKYVPTPVDKPVPYDVEICEHVPVERIVEVPVHVPV